VAVQENITPNFVLGVDSLFFKLKKQVSQQNLQEQLAFQSTIEELIAIMMISKETLPD